MTYTIQTENEMPGFFEALKNFVSAWKGVKVEADEEQYNANYVSSSIDPFYSKENMERLRASIMEMETTGGTFHEVTDNV